MPVVLCDRSGKREQRPPLIRLMLRALLIGPMLLAYSPPRGCGEQPNGTAIVDPLPTGAIVRLGTRRLPGRLKALSADGKTAAAVAEDDQILEFWNTVTGRKISSVQWKRDVRFEAFALAPDGTRAVQVAEDPEQPGIDIIDVATGQLRRVDFPGLDMARFVFTLDGKRLALAREGGETEVFLLDVAAGKKLSPCAGKISKVLSLAFSPDGKLVCAATETDAVIWEVGTGKEMQRVPQKSGKVLFGPGGKLLTCTVDEKAGTLRIVDVSAAKELFMLRTRPHRKGHIQTSAEGTVLAYACDGPDDEAEDRINTWSLADGTPGRTFPLSRYHRRDWTITPDGRTLATTSETDENGSFRRFAVQLWDVASGKELTDRGAGHCHPARTLVPANGGKTLLSLDGQNGRAVRRWDVASGKELRFTEWNGGGYCRSLVRSPDSSLLAVVSGRTIQVRDAATGKEIRTLKGHDIQTSAVAFSPDGKTLAGVGLEARKGTRTTCSLRLWDVASGKLLVREAETRMGDSRLYTGVFWLPDGKQVAFSEYENWKDQSQTTLFDVVQHRPVRVLDSFIAFQASPDGSLLVGRGKGGITLLTVRGKIHCELPDGLEHAVFSPDGRSLATEGDDDIIIWETATGAERMRIPSGTVTALAFLPDGKHLVTAGADTAILIWDLQKCPTDQ